MINTPMDTTQLLLLLITGRGKGLVVDAGQRAAHEYCCVPIVWI